MKFALGITGASGSIYFFSLVEFLLSKGHELLITSTKNGAEVFQFELGRDLGTFLAQRPGVSFYPEQDFFGPLASGTGIRAIEALMIVPCSMKTLAHIAVGASQNLLERCADVFIKEKKRVILVPRETPLSPIHLKNMMELANLGVTLLPAMPGFYHHPKSALDLSNHVVGKILDQIAIPHTFYDSWGDSSR